MSRLSSTRAPGARYMGGNAIGDEGAAELAAALGSNTTLATLDLRWNKIGDAGAARLADALASGKCPALATLDLGGSEHRVWFAATTCLADGCDMIDIDTENHH